MFQVLERQPSPAERFAEAFANLGQTAAQSIPQHFIDKEQKRLQDEQFSRENDALQRLIGEDISGIRDPKMRQSLLEGSLKRDALRQQLASKQESEKLKSAPKQQEKLQNLQGALQTIQEMKEIGARGNLGRGSAAIGFFGGDTAKDRAKYSQLGKSLISMASTIPIRNQREFDTLAHDLYDPSLPDDYREGILEAMEQIIRNSLQESGSSEFMVDEEKIDMGSEPKELDEAAIRKIYELSNGDKDKARKIARKMGYNL